MPPGQQPAPQQQQQQQQQQLQQQQLQQQQQQQEQQQLLQQQQWDEGGWATSMAAPNETYSAMNSLLGQLHQERVLAGAREMWQDEEEEEW